MRSLIIVGAIALLCATGPALASGRTGGTVASVNPDVGMVVLVDGRSFLFSDHEVVRELVPGETIGVGYFGNAQGVRTFEPCDCMGGAVSDQP